MEAASPKALRRVGLARGIRTGGGTTPTRANTWLCAALARADAAASTQAER